MLSPPEATNSLLNYPDLSGIIAFDFGDGGLVDGRLAPGPANQALANWLDERVLHPKTKLPKVLLCAQELIGLTLLEKHPHLQDSELFRIVPRTNQAPTAPPITPILLPAITSVPGM